MLSLKLFIIYLLRSPASVFKQICYILKEFRFCPSFACITCKHFAMLLSNVLAKMQQQIWVNYCMSIVHLPLCLYACLLACKLGNICWTAFLILKVFIHMNTWCLWKAGLKFGTISFPWFLVKVLFFSIYF